MNGLKKIWQKFLDIFGFRRNSKYVGDYLDTANMRSGTYMAGVIFAVEIWLLIRQTDKYIIPQLKAGGSFFQTLFINTSNFWLLLSLGAAMFAYSLSYVVNRKSHKMLLSIFITAGISIAFCLLMPFEFIYGSIAFKGGRYNVAALLKILLYSTIFLFDAIAIVASIFKYKGLKNKIVLSMVPISLFALACLIFGVMVSFSDFTSTTPFKDAAGNAIRLDDYIKINGEKVYVGSVAYQHKEIICFLMMAIYVGC